MGPDAIVVGCGAVGASTALHLARLGLKTVVLEKEPAPALHQSGRNSGVLHAGYNLKPGSDKARYCALGNRQVRAYCAQNGLPVRDGGILVVARTEPERGTLAELRRRAEANGVRSRMLDAQGLRDVEPQAAGIEALHALDGASFDGQAYVRQLVADAQREGVEFRFGTRVLGIADTPDGVRVATTDGALQASVGVNAAGLFADRVARRVAPDLRIVPFRGYYAELRPGRRDLVRSHIYAAPDLAFPFLGVHLSRRTDGRVIVGPGAMLAFGREAYGFWSLAGGGLAGTLAFPGFWRMLADPRMPRLIRAEVAKSLRLGAIADEAGQLVPALGRKDLVRGHAGNRAQVVDRQGRLVEDIVVREDGHAVHVLNAVSPGLTCSLPFGQALAHQAARLR